MNQMTKTPVAEAVTHALDFNRRNEAYEQGARCAELSRASLEIDRKSTRLNSSHVKRSRMPSSA